MNNIEKSLELMEYTKIANKNMIADAADKELFGAAVDDAIEALEKQLNNGWIPISDRVPEKYGLYIASVYYSEWICDYGEEDEIYKNPESIVLTAEYCKSMNGNHKWILHEMDGEITINGNEKVSDDLDCWSTYIKALRPLPRPYEVAK